MTHSEALPPIDVSGQKAPHRPPASWMFLLLALPYGIFAGSVGILLSYLLRREGAPVSSIANEIAIIGLPPILYFLWSPLSDFWMRRRSWLVASAAVSAGVAAAAYQLPSLASPFAVVLFFVAQCANMLIGASVGGLMAALVPEESRTRVSSMWQAGNVGGGALGGGGLLMLAEHVSRHTLGLAVAAVVFLPSLVALTVDEPPVHKVAGEDVGRRLGLMGRELKTTFLRWSAVPALLLLLSPLGSGGAIGLLPSIARDYGVSGNQVAWLNGLAGALLTAVGAFLVALVPGRVDARLTYAVIGLANALSIGVLCVAPTRPLTYLVGTVLYLITVGACYAVFTVLVLQVVGKAGRSGGSRYAIAVSLGNAPVTYMAWVDGRGAKWFGTRGFSGIDMAVSGVVAVGFLLWLGATRNSRSAGAIQLRDDAEPAADIAK